MRVLLVEDTKIVRTRLAAMVAAVEEVELVGQAVSIAEATAAIAALRPDVVILDIELGDGNGLVVLEFAKRTTPAPVVIVLSNNQDPIYHERSRHGGAEYFLDKSSATDRLSGLLRRLAMARASAGAEARE